MKTALYGRIVFGASAVLFGVIALMWYDSDTWQTLRRIWSLPFGTIIGGVLLVAPIGRGVGVPELRARPLGSRVLGVGFLLFSLAHLPRFISASTVSSHYPGLLLPVLPPS